MSREQDSRRKAKESARRDKARGHQTRRARGGKREELVVERNRKEGKNAINVTYIQMIHI